jgi:hypothetical protein
MRYRKIGKDHPQYKTVNAALAMGRWMCDAYTHNSPRGCSNPTCFKYVPRKYIRPGQTTTWK